MTALHDREYMPISRQQVHDRDARITIVTTTSRRTKSFRTRDFRNYRDRDIGFTIVNRGVKLPRRRHDRDVASRS